MEKRRLPYDYELEAAKILRGIGSRNKKETSFMQNAYFDIQGGLTEKESKRILSLCQKYVDELPSTGSLHELLVHHTPKRNFNEKPNVTLIKLPGKKHTMTDVHRMVMRTYYSFNGKDELTDSDILAIHNEVCRYFGVDYELSLSRSRKKQYSMCRYITMALVRPKSKLRQIAATLKRYTFSGVPDHSTVVHGINRVKIDMEHDKILKSHFIELKAKLGL